MKEVKNLVSKYLPVTFFFFFSCMKFLKAGTNFLESEGLCIDGWIWLLAVSSQLLRKAPEIYNALYFPG